MEEYGLDGLVASAEGVLAGLGPLAAGLARLAGEAGGLVTLDAMEQLVVVQGQELLRGLLQLCLDRQADAEVRVPEVTGADGVARGRAERGHARSVLTRLGAVRVRRIGYRAGVRGVASLFPRDAVLNVPPAGYSWPLQQLVVMFARAGSYEQAREFVAAVTGVRIGKRQLEQIAAAAAADAAAFCDAGPPDEPDEPGGPAGQRERQGQGGQAAGPGGEAAGPEGPLPLALSSDGKGVAMRPESRRARSRAPGQRVRNFSTRPGTGEKKGHKRIAETACVFDVIPQPRTPEDVMASHHGSGDGSGTGNQPPGPAPRAVRRRYRADIAGDRSAAITWLFTEAERRDPGHARDWIALIDGDHHQITRIEREAAARGVTVTILIDLIHVLEYLSAPRGAAPYPPFSGERLEGISLDLMAYPASKG